MLNAYLDCKKGKGCLYQFYHQYVVKDYQPEPSAAMQLGIWFEYQCTGALPRTGEVPEPIKLKNGNLSADYERMLYHIDKFKEIIVNYNIKINEIGKEIIVDRIKGILDIWCEIDGIPAIIDLKTSAQIGNKWDDYGWDDKNFSYSTHVLQPAIYKYLIYKSLGIYDAPFYYLVFSTKNTDILFWEVKYVDFEDTCNYIDKLAKELDDFIKYNNESEFWPICDYKFCQNCKMICTFRQEIPKIETKFLKLEL
jgi:hypothetical protein